MQYFLTWPLPSKNFVSLEGREVLQLVQDTARYQFYNSLYQHHCGQIISQKSQYFEQQVLTQRPREGTYAKTKN